MTNPIIKPRSHMTLPAITWDEDEIGEARAIQVCLRHLMREARDLNLDMTARVLTAAMDAVDMDLERRQN